MKIIRGRLNPADVSNPSIRYSSTDDTLQYTPDNGTTWVNVPELDPRHSAAFLKPPVAGSNKRCDSAANKVKWLKDFIDYETSLLVAGATITTLINGILVPMDLLSPMADLLSIIIDLADEIFGIGATALTAAFTDDQYDLLKCIFYCNADTNGQVSAGQLAQTESDITTLLNTTAAIVVNAILFVQGEIGLSNAGTLYSEVGDCTACDCCDPDFCTTYDFTAVEAPFVIWDGRGSYVGGVGFVSNAPAPPDNPSTVLGITFTFPCPKLIQSIRVVYTDGGGDAGDGTKGIYDLTSGVVQIHDLHSGDTWTGSRLMSEIGVEVDNHSVNLTGIQAVIIECS